MKDTHQLKIILDNIFLLCILIYILDAYLLDIIIANI